MARMGGGEPREGGAAEESPSLLLSLSPGAPCAALKSVEKAPADPLPSVPAILKVPPSGSGKVKGGGGGAPSLGLRSEEVLSGAMGGRLEKGGPALEGLPAGAGSLEDFPPLSRPVPSSRFSSSSSAPSSGATRGKSSTRRRSRSRPPSGAASAPQPWANLFRAPSSADELRLDFFPPTELDSMHLAVADEEDSEELVAVWKQALVGHVIGLKSSFNPLEAYIKTRWAPNGFSLFMLENGFFVCKFDLEEDLQRILEGFWTVKGHPIVLRRWSPDIRLEPESLKDIPIWISIHGLPLHLWSRRFIGKICSTIGTPLYLDRLTAERKRLSFARACVLVSADRDLPDDVMYLDQDGSRRTLKLSYSWKPRRCMICNAFGHLHTSCAFAQGKHGIPIKPKVQQTKPTAMQEKEAESVPPQVLNMQEGDPPITLPSTDCCIGERMIATSPQQSPLSQSSPNLERDLQADPMPTPPPRKESGNITQDDSQDGATLEDNQIATLEAADESEWKNAKGHNSMPDKAKVDPKSVALEIQNKGKVSAAPSPHMLADSDNDGSPEPQSRFSALLAVDEIEWKKVKPSSKCKGKNKSKPKG